VTTNKPTKAQRRADAVAQRKLAAQAAAARQRRNRVLIWGGAAVVVVIAIVVALVASGGNDAASATKWETAQVEVTGASLPQYDPKVTPDPAIGDTIPTLQGKSVFDGTPVKVAPDGKPQAVIFVAHWCPHCQAELPKLVTLAKHGVFDGMTVTAVATGTSKQAPNYPPSAWLKGVDWPFPVMADSPDATAAQAYGINAYPYFVLVNADGTVAGRGSGELPPSAIEADVAALKAGKPLPTVSAGSSSSAK
jgi:thiol-disulfide isomerase/thioredoxin